MTASKLKISKQYISTRSHHDLLRLYKEFSKFIDTTDIRVEATIELIKTLDDGGFDQGVDPENHASYHLKELSSKDQAVLLEAEGVMEIIEDEIDNRVTEAVNEGQNND